ncbi:hypothetical protein AB0L20_09615 [Streptomyces albidoflavus]|uniref:hypothetical protein n=1 Tax=Streptomyces albidoflavus TaxID=1886 RepID=UPI00344A5019
MFQTALAQDLLDRIVQGAAACARAGQQARFARPVRAPETLVVLERMESALFLLRGRGEKELETVFLDDLEFAWGPRIRLSR